MVDFSVFFSDDVCPGGLQVGEGFQCLRSQAGPDFFHVIPPTVGVRQATMGVGGAHKRPLHAVAAVAVTGLDL